ncbi:MAG: hypothetical protein E5Y55_03315 [Mesorhizobium sp.]|uniref:hypothetical protein n=1 Tax=Mesorhizobium sp. TaxID=1871066 RepID=UPI00120AA106|nr:hypothetical protein [Mesorhizobium sp.]TIL41451.1 MAG: hypothetical protein E5Y82_01920 [Mesorhizobium sp.]TIM49381.1 MAG: hypothetical protein E5Y55_03315 [Mesorhizobium sp.]
MQLRNKLSRSFAFRLRWSVKHLLSVAWLPASILYKRQLIQIIISGGLRSRQDQYCLRDSPRIWSPHDASGSHGAHPKVFRRVAQALGELAGDASQDGLRDGLAFVILLNADEVTS